MMLFFTCTTSSTTGQLSQRRVGISSSVISTSSSFFLFYSLFQLCVMFTIYTVILISTLLYLQVYYSNFC